AQAGRGREVHAFGQVGVAQAAVALQFGQELQVHAVEVGGGGHAGDSSGRRNDIASTTGMAATTASILRRLRAKVGVSSRRDATFARPQHRSPPCPPRPPRSRAASRTSTPTRARSRSTPPAWSSRTGTPTPRG